MSNLLDVRNEFEKDINKATSLQEVDKVEIKYLGRKGGVNNLLSQMKNMPAGKRKEYGQKVNELKNSIIRIIEQKKKELLSKSETDNFIDITLPGKPYPKGSLHPVTIAIEEITKIFQKIGFIKVSYPEVEWEYFVFESVNMPKNHPSRDDVETSFIDFPESKKYGKMLLTPHTTSGEVREMWRVGKPPIRMINISKCYRPNWDATHTPMFHQFEGLCVDCGINITHLKGTLDYFAKEYFGKDSKTRLRPHHFQFTEPSFEVDITCTGCKGTGLKTEAVIGKSNFQKTASVRTKCKVCKSGWLELGGTGMTHPNVLKAGRIDPTIYTGWAFGFGIERVIMMKYGIDDIRNYYSGDIRFLEQF